MGRMEMPGWSMGTRRYESPLCLGASGAVRQRTKHHAAVWARLVQIFCPVTTQASPSSTARVCTLARSEPALGSEYPWHHSSSPARMAGRKRRFCASVPKARRVGPTSCSPMCPSRPGPPARAYSSWKITSWISDAPRPPSSRGQPRPVQPAAPRRRSQARRPSTAVCSSPGPPRPRRAAKSPRRLSASQARTSARKASSAALKRRSIRWPDRDPASRDRAACACRACRWDRAGAPR